MGLRRLDSPRAAAGGSQLALSYLAVELARRGASVTLYCGTSRPRPVMGVSCVSMPDTPLAPLGHFDAFVVLNGPADCFQLRPHLDPATPLVLWTQHAADQAAMTSLTPRSATGVGRGRLCLAVASHHDDRALPRPVASVRAPQCDRACFEALFSGRDELARAKGTHLTLGYTSTPFRGLEVLLSVFPEVLSSSPRRTSRSSRA